MEIGGKPSGKPGGTRQSSVGCASICVWDCSLLRMKALVLWPESKASVVVWVVLQEEIERARALDLRSDSVREQSIVARLA